MNIKKICITAMLITLEIVATMVFAFPIPLGYANLGGCVLMLAGYYFGGRIGFFTGAIGSMLSDILLGYSYYAIPSFIIKGLAGLIIGRCVISKSKKNISLYIVPVISMIVVVIGYSFAGAVIELIAGASFGKSVIAGALAAPALSVEAVVNLVVFYILRIAFKATKLDKHLNKNVN